MENLAGFWLLFGDNQMKSLSIKSEPLSLKFWLCGVHDTMESEFSNLMIEILGDIDSEFKNILAC